MSYILGVSEATVSRLCTGDRRPSLDLTVKIELAIGWDAGAQARLLARHDGEAAYAVEFQRRMDQASCPVRLG